MNVRVIKAIFFILIFLTSKVGLALNVHYCGDHIAEISVVIGMLKVVECLQKKAMTSIKILRLKKIIVVMTSLFLFKIMSLKKRPISNFKLPFLQCPIAISIFPLILRLIPQKQFR